MKRLRYAALRLAEALLSSMSRFCNAVFLNGSTSISISARAALEPGPRWARARRIIDAVFWFDPNHCRTSLESEVAMARRTIATVDRMARRPHSPSADALGPSVLGEPVKPTGGVL